ncbi:MAG: hypothetical protein HY327_01360 [Chloroflexi bacterium]|nr:hypothetical protein [Chloroflexota bacterium]
MNSSDQFFPLSKTLFLALVSLFASLCSLVAYASALGSVSFDQFTNSTTLACLASLCSMGIVLLGLRQMYRGANHSLGVALLTGLSLAMAMGFAVVMAILLLNISAVAWRF